ncbi:hypothetical protein KP509_12G049200 [Ceratopteris richardii]|uniref:GDSL esterase/lipase n=1 Tax=Ceratopteris richardii TaxID=49495 RepID=A0A8T2TNE5_CERRI|nr:hypothetical protein KP509_12G049200 [Ceratopteris richardii]
MALRPLLLPFLMSMAFVSAACCFANSISTSFPSVFAFGASMIDSGQNSVAMPLRSGAEFYPYGLDYFGKPVGRWSNGRTFFDLITEDIGYGLLDPYLKSINGNFTYGVNFASSGSTATNTSASGDKSGGLFCLLVQVDQFKEFQTSTLSIQQGHQAKLKMAEHFSESIYFFEAGSNDYSIYGFTTDDYDTSASVNTTIAYMKIAFEALYTVGARIFIVMNVVPLGCAPGILADNRGNGTYDAYGCRADFNDLADLHNNRLAELLEDLRADYPEAQWILFDAHSIYMDAVRNPSNYGVKYPLQACCGAGGPYNCRTEVSCADNPKYVNGTYLQWTTCDDPSLYIVWDTIHPVESFGYYLAQGVLTGSHLTPSFDILEAVQSIKTAVSSSDKAYQGEQ